MTPEEIRKLAEAAFGSEKLKEMEEEQKVGADLFLTTMKAIRLSTITEWMYNEKWENVLVPVRLPEGMSELLKQMDEAKGIMMEDDRCSDCTRKDGCSLLIRNPSEIFLTSLLKYAFVSAIHRSGLE